MGSKFQSANTSQKFSSNNIYRPLPTRTTSISNKALDDIHISDLYADKEQNQLVTKSNPISNEVTPTYMTIEELKEKRQEELRLPFVRSGLLSSRLDAKKRATVKYGCNT